MKPIRWMLLCTGLLLTAPARSESWDPAGLYGGWPNDMAVDQQGTLFCAAEKGVYRRGGGSSMWERIRTLGDVNPRSIATGAPGTIYLGTDGVGGTGFMRSTNNGASWLTQASALSNKIVRDLELSLDYSTIWASTFGSGLYRSTDGGTSFTSITSLPTSYPTFLKIAPAGGMFVGAELGTVNLYYSGDGGDSWQPRDAGITGDVVGCGFDPTNGNICVASSAGVYRSTDNGITWTSMGAPAGAYSDVAIRGSRVYAANFNNIISGGRAYYTDDLGASWMQDAGLPGQPVKKFLNTLEGLYLGVTGPGPYRRSDAGAGWERQAEGMTDVFVRSMVPDPANGKVHVVAEQLGILSSADGVDWDPASTGLPPHEFFYSMTSSPNGYLYASGAYGGIYRSVNAGVDWSIISTVPATALATNEWGHVYAGNGNRIRRSTDHGSSWTNLPMLTGGVQGIADIACMGTDVYAATGYFQTGGRGVYRSTDGTNFAPFNDGLTNLDVTSIGIDPDPAAACRISAGTRGGLYDLSGTTWNLNASVGLGEIKRVRKFESEKMALLDLFIRKLQALCDWVDAKGPDEGYFTDFVPFMPALPAPDSGAPQPIRLLGTYGYGLWRLNDATTGVGDDTPAASGVPFRVSRNPFVRSTELSFALQRPGLARLEVFDVSGRKVATLLEGWQEAGPHSAEWDAADARGGIYFGRLTTGGTTQTRRLLLLR